MKLSDIIISIVIMLFFFIVSKIIINRNYKNDSVSKYYIPALYLRMFGAWLASFVFVVGDSGVFFWRGNAIYNLILQDFELWLAVIFPELGFTHPESYIYLSSLRSSDTSTYFTTRVSAFLSLFTFSSFYGNSLFFSALSFYASWSFFQTMRRLYPTLTNYFAVIILFLPSLLLWSSTVSKDTLTLSGVFFIISYIIRIFIFKEKRFFYYVSIVMWSYVLIVVKAYVLYCLFPALILNVFLAYKYKIHNKLLRKISVPVLFILSLLFSVLLMSQFQDAMGRYSLESIEGTAYAYQQWHTMISTFQDTGGGSAYSIGSGIPGDFSLNNLIVSFPQAINVTFFRPYLWEVSTFGQLLTSLESLGFLIYTLWVLFKVGLFRSIGIAFSQPMVIFALTFAIIFGFAVGFTTFNFGALARYKVPCLSLYLIGITLIYYYGMEKKKLVVSGQ